MELFLVADAMTFSMVEMDGQMLMVFEQYRQKKEDVAAKIFKLADEAGILTEWKQYKTSDGAEVYRLFKAGEKPVTIEVSTVGARTVMVLAQGKKAFIEKVLAQKPKGTIETGVYFEVDVGLFLKLRRELDEKEGKKLTPEELQRYEELSKLLRSKMMTMSLRFDKNRGIFDMSISNAVFENLGKVSALINDDD